jgi:hypothetical protein
MGRLLPANVHAYASLYRAYNKVLHSDNELHPLERTPQSNEESIDAKIYTAEKNVAVYQ